MTRASRFAVLVACVIGFAAPAACVWAQGSGSTVTVDPGSWSTPAIDPMEEPGGSAGARGGQTFTPIAAPIPFKNSQIGWGLALMVGAIHRFEPDTTIKPSTGAVAGFYTENQSWGVAAVEMARLQRDTWRLRGLLSHCELHYDYYGIGEDAGDAGLRVGIDQTMDFAVGSALRRITEGFYGGAMIAWMQTSADLDDPLPAGIPEPSDDLSRAELVAPGVQAELDTRNDDYWPSRGSFASVRGLFFTSALGSSRDFERYAAAWSWYTQLRDERLLLATNINGTAVTGDPPFYALAAVGSGQYGLRGFTQGRYRDNVMTTVQAELRYHSQGRFGAVLFGGFAQVASSVGNLRDARVLPAGGLGVRFQLTRNFPMHMRYDFAWSEKESLGYFSVGEAF